MTALAPTLQAFFTERLARQKNASPHTVTAYRDALRMLVQFAARRIGTGTRVALIGRPSLVSAGAAA